MLDIPRRRKSEAPGEDRLFKKEPCYLKKYPSYDHIYLDMFSNLTWVLNSEICVNWDQTIRSVSNKKYSSEISEQDMFLKTHKSLKSKNSYKIILIILTSLFSISNVLNPTKRNLTFEFWRLARDNILCEGADYVMVNKYLYQRCTKNK